MSQLDQFALSLEITLLSLIESLALYFLATSAVPVVHGLSQIEYIPFIIAGVLLVFIFWAQSILHAVSFIRWPIHIGHMFLYFLAAFMQIIAFNNLTDPLRWFFWSGMFSLVILCLYIIDLRLIREERSVFEVMPGGAEFIDTIEKRHRKELNTIVPAALIFNFGLYALLLVDPARFTVPAWIAIFGLLQAGISFFAFADGVRNFRERTALVGNFWKD